MGNNKWTQSSAGVRGVCVTWTCQTHRFITEGDIGIVATVHGDSKCSDIWPALRGAGLW